MIELATLCEIAETGSPDVEVVDWIRSSSASESFHAFGIDDGDRLAAFSYVECIRGNTGLTTEVRVRPGLGLDLGAPLLAAAARAAAEFDETKPLRLFTNAGATAQRAWLEARGGREIRHFWRMTIDLDDAPPPVPPAPPGVTLRHPRDDEDDLRAVHAIVETSFADHFGHTDDRTYDEWIGLWRRRHGWDLTLWWIAERDGDPVSVLLGTTLEDDGHVGTLGTLPRARGLGVGTVLLRTSFAEFHRRGYRRVSLGVDSENTTNAVRLYESVGMHPTADWALYELSPPRA